MSYILKLFFVWKRGILEQHTFRSKENLITEMHLRATNGNINLRINTHSSNCPFCPTTEENMDHVLKKCHRALEIWRSVNFTVVNITNFNDWLNINFTKDHNNIIGLSHSVIPSNVEFTFTIWAIWLRRNAWVFNRKNIPFSSSINSSRWATHRMILLKEPT